MAESISEGRWRAKVAAWVHDPAEKALVLLRDPSGHEGGTVKALRQALFGEGGVPAELAAFVRHADWWASAADRPDFPRNESDGRYARWAQVDFATETFLVHPLSGTEYSIRSLTEISAGDIKAISTDHLCKLIAKQDGGGIDWKRTLLQLWRLAPESPAKGLGALWNLLPADTRVPDHSIWEHLRLTSAFAGAFAGGGQPALLVFSFGPVQSFIAQARSTSDLWAGSHLLSRIAWEGMKVVCDRFGPDAIIFPDLRGVPLVDRWLETKGVNFTANGAGPEWKRLHSDANPLFAATLPNRFLAVIPDAERKDVAEEVEKAVREWVRDRAVEAWGKVIAAAGLPAVSADAGREQIARQLASFPETWWAAVPWSLVDSDSKTRVTGTARLKNAMANFYPAAHAAPGFLGSDAWKLLSREISVEGTRFFQPFPGVLYPAVYDLAERALAAAKTTRTFEQLPQEGYRCTLCGVREWLTTDREALYHARGSTGPQDPWSLLSGRKRAWCKSGEHLCAPCTLKRLWPTLFVEEVEEVVGKVQRYVVSTHTMALASTLEEIAGAGEKIRESEEFADLEKRVTDLREKTAGDVPRVALPRSMVLRQNPAEKRMMDVLARLPAALDLLGESTDANADAEKRGIEGALGRVLSRLRGKGTRVPEAYYALVLMDGDRMGAWLSATEPCGRPQYRSLWHPKIRNEVTNRAQKVPELDGYLKTRAAASPAYHMALSHALNGFSTVVSRIVVEDLFLGKVLYAGGDDLLAMVSVRDLFPVMLALRCAYSGIFPAGDEEATWELLGCEKRLKIGNGYVWRMKQQSLLRAMGEKATASAGAVIAHHSAPLGAVLRELRAAEGRAKQRGGRDAFSISLMKRAGGTTQLTSPWWLDGVPGSADGETGGAVTTAGVLLRLQRLLSGELSRRAAYHMTAWLRDLPRVPDGTGDAGGLSQPEYRALLQDNLAAQMKRQVPRESAARKEIYPLARDLAALAVAGGMRVEKGGTASVPDFLTALVTVAEFLARAERGGGRG